jgi:hypothetical protein
VTFHPTGHSMVPLIRSRDEVVVAPVDAALVQAGDIVLTRVAGSVYIHLVKAVDSPKRRVLIGNNRGGTNGWTGFDRVYGIALSVAGVERPEHGTRSLRKVLGADQPRRSGMPHARRLPRVRAGATPVGRRTPG